MKNQLSSKKVSSPLSGSIRVAGDKSISHRALILGGIATGKSEISGLLEGEDVMRTADAMRAFGAQIEKDEGGVYHVQGTGLGGLAEPCNVIDMGNSGTSVRLLMGLVAGCNINVCFSGDESLSTRPMARVLNPLSKMGALYMARDGGRLPLSLKGAKSPMPIEYKCPVASAQVKSAILLAGLAANGRTTVIEPTPTRDYTETMLREFGVNVEVDGNSVSLVGGQELSACNIEVPADPSSAVFPALCAMLIDGSEITMPCVGINPRRDGFFRMARKMGASISYANQRDMCGQPVADIIVKGVGTLNAIEIPKEVVPSMIDEFPAFSMLAACSNGTTKMSGLSELRVKESDRLSAVAKGLTQCGVKLEEGAESLVIYGNGSPPKGGVMIETKLDHRIAMSFLSLGCSSHLPISIDDSSPINTSFPHFDKLMNSIGICIE